MENLCLIDVAGGYYSFADCKPPTIIYADLKAYDS